jgi:C-terminal peptidase prc
MRELLACLAVSLAGLPAWAANPNGTPSSVPQHVHAQAQTYANQMMAAVNYIKGAYVRDIAKPTLVEAAIQGLYETAREPLPAGWKSDLERARVDVDFEHILLSAREKLGDREELRDQKAIVISLKALPRVLDPYCGIPTVAEVRRSYGDQTQLLVGLELESAYDNTPVLGEEEFPPRGVRPRPAPRSGPFRILNVLPGSPAQRAGIKPGDLLTHIDDKLLEGPQVAALLLRLQAGDGDGSKFVFTVTRAGQAKPLRIEVIAMQFTPETVFGVNRRSDNSWNYMLDPIHKIGYIRLGFIDSTAPKEMADALTELKAAEMRGLVLDLRGNPGGYIDPATQVASLFIPSGDIAVIHGKNADELPPGQFAPPGIRQGEQRYQADGSAGAFGDYPIVALINQETMGGGEMIAAALQDHHRATLVGQRTFGKGSVQNTPTNFPVGIQYKLTTGMFSRPNGKPLHRFPDSKISDDWGVRPARGMEFPMSLEVSKRVKEWMQAQTLRPGDSREILPLDDPENDPQRQFAVRQLLKMVK